MTKKAMAKWQMMDAKNAFLAMFIAFTGNAIPTATSSVKTAAMRIDIAKGFLTGSGSVRLSARTVSADAKSRAAAVVWNAIVLLDGKS